MINVTTDFFFGHFRSSFTGARKLGLLKPERLFLELCCVLGRSCLFPPFLFG